MYSLASSHSGNTIIHGGPGGLLQLHDSRIKATKTGKSQLSLMGHKDTVRSIIMHPSDTTFITASSDCTVKIWDTRLAACTTTLRFESPVWALTAATSAGDSNNNTCLDKFWVGCRDGSVIKVGRGSAGFPPNLSVASSARGASFDNKNSSRHHQQQRQLWKTGSTGEDLDRMRPGGGSSRPQSVSAPLPLTDVGGRFGEVEGVDCVLVCKELESVHSISGVDGESIWVATASSTVNCWVKKLFLSICLPLFSTTTSSTQNDIPFKSSQVINFARSKPIDLSNRPLLVPSGALIDQFSTYLPESNNELSEATSELLDKKEGNVDSPSNINGDDDNDDPSVAGIPVFVEPIGSLRGGPRIVKFESLNDRRRVVVLDSYGNVSVWDIIRCKRIKLIFGYRWDNTRIRSEDICVNYESDEVKGAAEVYGNDEMTSNELFKKVVEDANTVDWVANWCVLDAKCGVSKRIVTIPVLFSILNPLQLC